MGGWINSIDRWIGGYMCISASGPLAAQVRVRLGNGFHTVEFSSFFFSSKSVLTLLNPPTVYILLPSLPPALPPNLPWNLKKRRKNVFKLFMSPLGPPKAHTCMHPTCDFRLAKPFLMIFIDFWWFVDDCFTIFSWLFDDFSLIFSWLFDAFPRFVYDCSMSFDIVFKWFFDDFSQNFHWFFNDFLTIFLRFFYDFLWL